MIAADTEVESRPLGNLTRYSVTRDGRVLTSEYYGKPYDPPTPLKLTVSTRGYPVVQIKSPEGNRIRYVHQLVAEAFIGPCPPGMFVCHNDGNPLNNSVENLRYATPRENQLDRKGHGTANIGEQNPMSKLRRDQVAVIKRLLGGGTKRHSIAKQFGVNQATIFDIEHGRTWKDVEAVTLPERSLA